MANNQRIELALGRIFRLGSRPEQAGDVADYERCRQIILDELAPIEGYVPFVDRAPSYARDHRRGAQGD